MTLKENSYTSLEAAASALAKRLEQIVQAAIFDDGNAVIAVSGGRTPKLVFARLLESNINWSNVIVTLTDERWVANDHSDSNERLVRDYLLKGRAERARFIPLYGGESNVEAGLQACESRLQSLGKPIDAVYLGMGADGHVASLFPNTHVIQSNRSKCVAVSATPDRLPRLSLSIKTILRARAVFLLYSGRDKHKAYLAAKESDNLPDSPLWSILSQQVTPVCVLRTI